MQRVFLRRLCSTPSALGALELQKAKRQLEAFQSKVCSKTRCRACWLPPRACMCQYMSQREVAALGVDVAIAIHYKEYGKMANTAKLVRSVLPSSQLFVHPLDNEGVSGILARAESHPVVLWPGEGSVPASEYRARAGVHGQHITLFALDGTWRQVKAMARRYAALPRVHVSNELLGQGSAVPHLRREVRPTGASTAEAIALALAALGEPQCTEPILSAIRELNARAASGALGSPRHAKPT